jgi:prevent-host-death family protein
MQQIGIRDLKNQATEILRTVREQKVEYVVTYRGLPVARLLPLTDEPSTQEKEQPTNQKTRAEVAQNIKQMLEEGRALPERNRLALELMHEWLSEPDEHDEAWWREFDEQLSRNRFTLRRTVRQP